MIELKKLINDVLQNYIGGIDTTSQLERSYKYFKDNAEYSEIDSEIKESIDIDEISDLICQEIENKLCSTFDTSLYSDDFCNVCQKNFGDYVDGNGNRVQADYVLRSGVKIIIVH